MGGAGSFEEVEEKEGAYAPGLSAAGAAGFHVVPAPLYYWQPPPQRPTRRESLLDHGHGSTPNGALRPPLLPPPHSHSNSQSQSHFQFAPITYHPHAHLDPAPPSHYGLHSSSSSSSSSAFLVHHPTSASASSSSLAHCPSLRPSSRSFLSSQDGGSLSTSTTTLFFLDAFQLDDDATIFDGRSFL